MDCCQEPISEYIDIDYDQYWCFKQCEEYEFQKQSILGWMKQIKQNPDNIPDDLPEELKFPEIEKNFRTQQNNTLASLWIKRLKKQCPQWMVFKGIEYVNDTNGDNISMIWIQVLQKPLHQYLIFKNVNSQVNNQNENIATLYLKNIGGPFPMWMRYDGMEKQLDCDNSSLMQLWIQYTRTEFPNWMLYSGCEKQVNDIGENPAMVWVYYIEKPFPLSLMYVGYEHQKNYQQKTIIQLWEEHIQTKFPQDLLSQKTNCPLCMKSEIKDGKEYKICDSFILNESDGKINFFFIMGICCGNINYQETLCLRRMAKNLYYGSDIDDIDDGLSVMTENISDI